MKAERQRGRPLSETLEQRFIDAAIDLIVERRSFEAISIDAVSAAANAGKASFYRRWKDRNAFLVSVMASLREPPLPSGPTGSLARDLETMLGSMFGIDVRRTRLVHSALIAEGRSNRALIAAYVRDIVAPRREAVINRLTLAVERGELGPSTDVPMLHELLTAPVLKILMLSEPENDVPENFVGRIVAQALRGAGQPVQPSGT